METLTGTICEFLITKFASFANLRFVGNEHDRVMWMMKEV